MFFWVVGRDGVGLGDDLLIPERHKGRCRLNSVPSRSLWTVFHIGSDHQKLSASLSSAVIIVMTRQEAEDYRQATLAVGADGFISKASLTTDLMSAIRRLTQTP
jgi:hypothetical protein